MLGLLGGGLVAVAGLVGYVVVPLVTGDLSNNETALIPWFKVTRSSNLYHFVVLVVPSFLATFVGVIQARRWGLKSRIADVVIVGQIIAVPFVMAFVSYLAAALWIGLSFLGSGSLANPVLFAIGMLYFVFLSLIIGLAFASLVFLIVLLAVGAGSVGGYLSARTVIYIWRFQQDG
jgi:hypothetical protein